MKTVILASSPYGAPDKAGFGVGLKFFESILHIYRRDNPGLSKLEAGEMLSFLQALPRIMVTSEAAVYLLKAALVPIGDSPAVSQAIDLATTAEIIEATNVVSPLVDVLVGDDLEHYLDMISNVPAGFSRETIKLLTDPILEDDEPVASEIEQPAAEAAATEAPAVEAAIEQPSEAQA